MASNAHQIGSAGQRPDGLVECRAQNLMAQHDLNVSECKARAKQQREELTARETRVYQNPVLEGRKNGSLMMILTTSKPH